jgi:hypothetical protein
MVKITDARMQENGINLPEALPFNSSSSKRAHLNRRLFL